MSSELAYNILSESFGDGSERYKLLRIRDELLETLHTHYWRYALRWRYTPLKLDLLQLAVICRNEDATRKLMRLDYNGTCLACVVRLSSVSLGVSTLLSCRIVSLLPWIWCLHFVTI